MAEPLAELEEEDTVVDEEVVGPVEPEADAPTMGWIWAELPSDAASRDAVAGDDSFVTDIRSASDPKEPSDPAILDRFAGVPIRLADDGAAIEADRGFGPCDGAPAPASGESSEPSTAPPCIPAPESDVGVPREP